MRALQKAIVYFIMAYKEPGPKWHIVSKPIEERAEALRQLQAQWRLGRLARIIIPKDDLF